MFDLPRAHANHRASVNKIYGNTFTIPPALGDKIFHPFGDFLLHDIGTGDGFVVLADEHFGRRVKEKFKNNLPPKFAASIAYKCAPRHCGACACVRA
jgi:hypothetical protein